MGHEPSRIPPQLPAHAMKTYSIVAPKSTHWRAATCEEVDCPPHLHGWRTAVDERTDLGQGQAYYIRKQSGRSFTEHRDEAGMTVFTFGPGQRCFEADNHRIRIDRPELFLVRGGDYRGNPRGTETFTHTTPESWVDDFANHQQALADRLEQG